MEAQTLRGRGRRLLLLRGVPEGFAGPWPYYMLEGAYSGVCLPWVGSQRGLVCGGADVGFADVGFRPAG